jgi:hydrogenase maturation protein HypF
MTQVGLKIWVTGIVQGVGFRPFIFGLADRCKITGWVRNTSSGVEIEINGRPQDLEIFMQTLRKDPPPLARIDSIHTEDCPPNGYSAFEILASQPNPNDFIPISPDFSICPDCQRELFDPTDRRYRYPFINCTNCGPRFTIIKDIPYDRPKTTMSGFPLCPECDQEYHNPLDRRFHAQPVACPVCGPYIWLEAEGQRLAQNENALSTAREWLKNGKILAIKGLGGFHLACDASNPQAVALLRSRKKRSDKPFALMAFSPESIERHCLITPAERDLITARQRPIVLLEKRPDSNLAEEIAPGQRTLGFMLPYTPLHLLLLEPAPDFPEVLVMTSGNLSEEPIAYQDEEAGARLAGLADAYLLHNRDIYMRTDDSVTRVVFEKPYLLRRSRGYAPDSIQLPVNAPHLLACGAELKNTFCLTREKYAFLSHHIGDLENYETLQSFEEGIRHFERLFRITPERLACDLHPNYLASRYAESRARQENLPLLKIQHHHAHLAACLADNGWNTDEPVIGLSFDGTGYGTDGLIWGSEVLLGNYQTFQRLYHLKYVPMPGGDLAIRKPSRMALAHLVSAGLDWEVEIPAVRALCESERTTLLFQINKQINAPLTSSMGRLFDAAASLAGVRQESTYEGQAAIEFEALADPHEKGFYEFTFKEDLIDPAPVWEALLQDWRVGRSASLISARFHNGVARLALEMCRVIREKTGCRTVALSGGVWQNRLLLERSVQNLMSDQFIVLTHHQTPANDGCIALGQAMIAVKSDY